MTIEERINDDLRQLSAEFLSASWQTGRDEKSDDETSTREPSSTSKRKGEPDLKNKASRLLDLMISLGEIERRGGGKKGS